MSYSTIHKCTILAGITGACFLSGSLFTDLGPSIAFTWHPVLMSFSFLVFMAQGLNTYWAGNLQGVRSNQKYIPPYCWNLFPRELTHFFFFFLIFGYYLGRTSLSSQAARLLPNTGSFDSGGGMDIDFRCPLWQKSHRWRRLDCQTSARVGRLFGLALGVVARSRWYFQVCVFAKENAKVAR